jgi:hypothetical protein
MSEKTDKFAKTRELLKQRNQQSEPQPKTEPQPEAQTPPAKNPFIRKKNTPKAEIHHKNKPAQEPRESYNELKQEINRLKKIIEASHPNGKIFGLLEFDNDYGLEPQIKKYLENIAYQLRQAEINEHELKALEQRNTELAQAIYKAENEQKKQGKITEAKRQDAKTLLWLNLLGTTCVIVYGAIVWNYADGKYPSYFWLIITVILTVGAYLAGKSRAESRAKSRESDNERLFQHFKHACLQHWQNIEPNIKIIRETHGLKNDWEIVEKRP